MARGLKCSPRMRAETRPFRILPPREDRIVEDLRTDHVRLVPHACEACGELTLQGVLCNDCEDRTRPHIPDDPYDVIGGDNGAE